jgi:aminoglycoside phosphotransferase (APT) family kinase protein
VGENRASEGTRIEIDDDLVAALIREQHPHLSRLEVGRRYVFDDHMTVRLGDLYCLNLPTAPGLDEAMASTSRWLRSVSPDWTFPAGVPLLTGEPTASYPFRWEVARWLPGSNAGVVNLEASAATDLGKALRQVHTPASARAPIGVEAGTPLSRHRKTWRELNEALRGTVGPKGNTIDPAILADRWEVAVDTVIDTQPRWTHGNLDPRYVVSDRGRFGGICTWWTFGAGDPAADIAAAFLLINRTAEAEFVAAYGKVSRATRQRIAGYWLLRAVRYATSTNPFLWRLGWYRLDELVRLGDLD